MVQLEVQETLIERGEDYTISIGDKPTTRVPHSPEKREDGSENYGFFDLRNRPELVDEIREAKKCKGLATILRAANSPRSMLMTIGCECELFENSNVGPFYVGSFVNITYRDHMLNNNDKNLIALARLIQADIRRINKEAIWYRLIVMPLFEFFGLPNRYELVLKVFARGNSAREAWKAFDQGALEAANAIQRLM
jgi:hypothetical protein